MEKLTEQPLKKKIRNFITLNSMTKDEIRQEYNEIYDKLKEYENKQEWISVEERLPKKHETVLVCCRGENNSVISMDCLCSSGKWYDQDDDVTHWMPIPQPPQMKGE